MPKVYTTLKLMNGDTVTIDEITGGTMLLAAIGMKREDIENPIVFGFNVCAWAVKKDGQPVGLNYIKLLMIDDVNLVLEAVNSQLIKVNGKG